jgi:hypothetical protein
MKNIRKRNILVQAPSRTGAAGLLPLPRQSKLKKKKKSDFVDTVSNFTRCAFQPKSAIEIG